MSDDPDHAQTRILDRTGPKDLPFARPRPTDGGRREPQLGAFEAVPPAPLPPRMKRPQGMAPVIVPPIMAAKIPEPAVAPAAPEAAVPVSPPAAAPVVPVVGWLIIIAGPGRGSAMALHKGRNGLGRTAGSDLRADFGDAEIAADGHVFILYDDETRSFLVEDGKKKDLVRVNDRLLSGTLPLAAGDRIRIGRTTFGFVPFCGPAFDWSDAEPRPQTAPDHAAVLDHPLPGVKTDGE